MNLEKHLNILACPACKGKLVMGENSTNIYCISCNWLFAVRDGIPVMLIEETSYKCRNQGQ